MVYDFTRFLGPLQHVEEQSQIDISLDPFLL